MKTVGQFTLFDTLDEFATFLAKPVARKVTRVLVHHTLIPSYGDFTGNDHFAHLKSMKTAHLKRGFSDIGQNLTIFPDGKVAVCRSFENDPACTKGANSRSICIENLGNFDKGRDVMTAEQREAIIQVTAMLCKRFKIPVDTEQILYHHWFHLESGVRNDGAGGNKSCPGTSFFGGNKVSHCKANFIPPVSAALAALTGGVVSLPAMKVVSADGLTIRSGPRKTFDPVGSLPDGAIVHIHEAKGIWRRIDPTAQHWVSSRFLVSQ